MQISKLPYFDNAKKLPLSEKFISRPYQKIIARILAKWTDSKGRIVAPPSAGKTFIAACFVKTKLHTGRLHLVVGPRIALLNQLITEYRNIIGDGYISYGFHSGPMVEQDATQFEEHSSTNPDAIKHELDRAIMTNQDLIVFSTYASFHRLKDYAFQTVIFDESQYCIHEGHFENIEKITAKQKLFMTATEKFLDTRFGRGHNNKDVFGELLYFVPPQVLLDGEWVLPPMLHVMAASKKAEEFTLIDEVVNLAEFQIEENKKVQHQKILFAMKDTSQIKEIRMRMDFLKQKFPGYQIFTIVSHTGEYSRIDGVKVPRELFMKRLHEAKNALVFHYDILSEGIDISGITGVVILRNMDQTTLIQTLGRAQRVLKSETKIRQKDRKKQYAYISVMSINGNRENEEYIKKIVREIRAGGWELSSENIRFSKTNEVGLDDESSLLSIFTKDRRKKAQKLLTNILHEVEKEVDVNELKYVNCYDLMKGIKI